MEIQGIVHSLLKDKVSKDSSDNIPGLFRYGKAALEKDFDGITDAKQILSRVLGIYIDKLGLRVGFDTFHENYALCRLIIRRGKYTEEKYYDLFKKFELLQVKHTGILPEH